MYQKILVPLDGSSLAECVIPHVEAIATGCSVPEVVILRVLENFTIPSGIGDADIPKDFKEKMVAERKAEATKYLDNTVAEMKKKGINAQSVLITHETTVYTATTVIKDDIAETIAQYIEKNSINLVLIATHGRSGISRWAWGSVADKVLRSSCVPVVMVRSPGCTAAI